MAKHIIGVDMAKLVSTVGFSGVAEPVLGGGLERLAEIIPVSHSPCGDHTDARQIDDR